MKRPSRQTFLAGFEDSPAPASDRVAAPRPDEPPPPSLAGKRVFVVDAHSLIYQVFHAMPEMTSPTGLPVAAVHGFTRDIADLIEKWHPDFLICAFDHPDDTFRHALYTQYKEQRESMPDDLRPQIPLIQRMLAALGVPALSCPQYEADDILATVAVQTETQGGDCFLVTGDKDCRQLLSAHVKILNIRKGELFDVAALEQTWGIRPEQVVDFQALVGDSVDNIPGVPLIGPKIAQELLQRFDSLEAILAQADQVPGQKRRENLVRGREQALLSRELARLRTDTPVEIDWRQARVGQGSRRQLRALCEELGFRRIADRLAGLLRTTDDEPVGETSARGTDTRQQADPAAGALGAVAGDGSETPSDDTGMPPAIAGENSGADSPRQPAWQAHYRTIATLDQLDAWIASLAAVTRLSIDTETTSERPRWAELVGLSFAWDAGEACYIPVRAPAGEPQLNEADVLERLRPILGNPNIAKIGQNLKYDLIVLRAAGVDVQGLAIDTMVADYILEPGERAHNLDELARRYLRHDTIRIDELIGKGKQQRRMDQVPVPLITAYAAEDADVPFRLAAMLERRLVDDGLFELYRDVEMRLIEVLAELEYHGIRIDVERLGQMSSRFGTRLEQLERDIHALAGRPFNIDSPAQLAKILFDELNLPVVKRTKTGKSTDAEVLEELASLHPLPAKMVEYRQLAKLKGTYVDALPEMVNPRTGRVHSSFKQDVAATGRLSSTDPNLQNIPVRTDEGREIRSAFTAGEPGWELVAADYSQIELRVLAHFSRDEALREAFAADQDIHTRVAAQVYGVPDESVTRDMRRSAKAVNFGVIYGQSAFGLAKSLGIAKDEAARFIEAYFARYPGVAKFMEEVLDQARDQGYVKTILGRRRPIQGVRDAAQRGDSKQRNLPERIAINTVIQGSAADLIKLAMIRIHDRLAAEPMQARMLLQIHDELVFETAPSDRERLCELVTREMEAAGRLDVPLKVDVKWGQTWADCD